MPGDAAFRVGGDHIVAHSDDTSKKDILLYYLGLLSRKTRKYGHPSTALFPFRHSGTVLAGIQAYAELDSG
jgi:hypothetical protein